ncbi:hypothetical protein MBRA1_002407 [Malassezia brasiliensis]|uniref:XPG-I domain-containing protein n=1 Tax=Malassezia brasiliensis TaxID=1821822 RepID=A0AAF0DUL4_9BASI|nr:hypothetical protein MBRA1_002407 [Malassezia brasiliensis]
MGVPGLWPALASAGVDRTLAELAWAHWDRPGGTHAPLRLGIDASLWLFHARKAQGGRNPALRALFFRLARLLRLPIVPVFVLDGAQRPAFKRDAAVYTGTHAIQTQFCEMLDAFRFPYWTAPGEAEAELAWMNRAGILDAVLTDDADALLFGAQVVVRNHAWRDDDPADDADDEDAVVRAAVYDTRLGTWALDTDGMVLVAMLSGADYDPRGMLHCGVKTAVGLAEAGLGARLLRGFRDAYDAERDATQLSAAWMAHAAAWRVELCRELATNASGRLPRRMPKLASDVAPDFLCSAEARRVLASYVWPHTSEHDPARAADARRLCTGGRVHLGNLAAVVAAHFHWTSATLAQRFVRLVFPGVLMQELQQYAQTHDEARPETCAAAAVARATRRTATTPPKGRRTAPSPTASPVREITAYFARIQAHSPPQPRRRSCVLQAHATRTTSTGTEVRVSYDPSAYVAQLPGTASADVQRVWVPECLLLAAGTPERAVYRAYEAQQRRKLTSPSKKARAADQPALTAFFRVEKPARRNEAVRVGAAQGKATCVGAQPGKELPAAVSEPSVAPVRPEPPKPPSDVFGDVRTPPHPPRHIPAARPPTSCVVAPSTPDTSVEFLGMRAADTSGETSVSSIESPRALLQRVCRPSYIS